MTSEPRDAARRAMSGSRIERLEDDRFLRGAGRFTADFNPPGSLIAVVLRSRVAHGRLLSIDAREALATDGVFAVLTGEDASRDGLGGIPWEVCPPGFEHLAGFPGDPRIARPQPVLAVDHVRYVGEPVALVLGDSLAAAQSGSERVRVEIDELAPVVGLPVDALDSLDAPPGAVFSATVGDAAHVASLMAEAAHVVSLRTHVPRLAAAPMETRGYIASYDAAQEAWSVVASAGKPHPVRDTIAHHVLHVHPQKIRVIAPDIGGGFGGKNVAHAEMALVLWAAKRMLRPIRWISGRTEAFLSDMQGRDHWIDARLACDEQGRFLAVHYRSLVDLGAYLGPRAVVPSVSGLKVLTGPYSIPSVFGRVDALHSNTVPTCPYRGAGVPETAFVIERLVDKAARATGLDPARVRALNLVPKDAMPWPSPTGAHLHSCDFPALLSRACEMAGWDRRHERSATPGRLRGQGMAFTIEAYGTSFDEAAEIAVHDSGRVDVLIGTKSSGQGHETTYAQIVSDRLGVDLSDIRIVQGDTARIARGNGTGASRSITTGGSAILRAADQLLKDAALMAAQLLQCDGSDVVHEAGAFRRSGLSGSHVGLAAIAGTMPGACLRATASFQPTQSSFPNGCHVADVEVDPETGAVEILSYCAVQDAGNAIHPTIVENQLRGGIVQGIGAALMEAVRYETGSGQAITATFLDYALPRALDLSRIDVHLRGVPCSSNPLGAKAVGEAGTVAAPPAIINAIVAALAPHGITHLDLPATPHQIWSALLTSSRPSLARSIS